MPLHLVLPYSDWAERDDIAAFASSVSLPATALLLGRGSRQPAQPESLDIWLANRCGLADLPVAPLTMALDLPGEEPGFWMRADPVHLRVDRDRLLLVDPRHFSLTQAEADGLCSGLNALYRDDGFRFVAATPSRWYLRLPADPGLHWSPIDAALGHDVREHLPKGDGALKWHGLLNEIQMCLYNHPVNDARVAAGQPAIQSVWLWGGGQYPLADKPVAPAQPVLSDLPLVVALTQHGGGQARPAPAAFDAVQGDAVVVLDALRDGNLYGDAHGWLSAWLALEADWFAPALAALKAGRLDELAVSMPEAGFGVKVTQRALWALWRKPVLPWEVR
ncbi:hypothetical protein [Jeongeupia chitinilytica]|uniref:Phosphoglycerate mutase n=1 Tax=Jeongeupia chitinilytica TaxID=1041641 RepID=A0ABQ3GY03_9NEIS|nr:hypothetical protein [Jeongeupia chitinilytica]GHD59992.1 hypothetical protein GCM10007350_12230 [Jeongeupia chitinilytica]